MYCPKCKQQFAGDICPNCGYKSAFRKMDDLGGTVPKSLEIEKKLPVVSAPSTSHKDKPAVGGFKPMDSLGGETKQPEVTVKKDVPASGGSKPMNVLPSAETGKTTDTPLANTGDKPATGGFGPMNSLDIPNEHNTNGEIKVPAAGGNTPDPVNKKVIKPKNFTNFFKWKRWLPTIAGVVVLVIAALSVVFSNGLTRNQAEEMLISALTVSNVNVQGEPELLEKIEKKNGFEIRKLTKGSSGYIAQVIVYSPDLYSIAKTLDTHTEWQDIEDVRQALENTLDTAQPVQVQTSIVFDKTDKGYDPILTAEFLDAYYGGVIRLYQDMLSEAVRKMR